MAKIVRGDRVINLDGGTYNEKIEGTHINIQGDYVKGEPQQRTERNITSESKVINEREETRR